MKFISSQEQNIDTKDDNIAQEYNKLGLPIVNPKEKCFAQHTSKDIGKGARQNKYYIITHNNIPYDPNGPDGHRELYLTLELKSVSKQTFDYYLMYLKTKNSLYITRTQRSYING
jgi:hypothetical protein